ncbi:phage tail protein [Methylohalobius crimeensis]|uniref:phage tail protein n=1 Tax=Methylohalobius crimeensis TaxID=244365 RepID=UPI0003B481E9|nr:phage tail protein [Methylohalobius crimeensis]
MAKSIEVRGLKQATRRARAIPKALDKARLRSVNKAATESRKQSSKLVRADVNLKARDVNKRLEVKRANKSRPHAKLIARSRPMLLSRFGARVLTRRVKHPSRSKGFPKYGIPAGRKFAGVSLKVKRAGSRKKMRGGFFIELKGSGATGLAVRTGKGRDAYRVLYGPSVRDVVEWNEDEIEAYILDRIGEHFAENLTRELDKVNR